MAAARQLCWFRLHLKQLRMICAPLHRSLNQSPKRHLQLQDLHLKPLIPVNPVSIISQVLRPKCHCEISTGCSCFLSLQIDVRVMCNCWCDCMVEMS